MIPEIGIMIGSYIAFRCIESGLPVIRRLHCEKPSI